MPKQIFVIMRKYISFFILGFICSFGIFAQQETVQKRVTPVLQTAPAPVVFSDDTLFYIDVRQVSSTPKERAEDISERLEKIFDEDLYRKNGIATITDGPYVDVICGDLIIMSLSDEDALSKGVSNQELADQYIAVIDEAFKEAYKERSLLTILTRIGLVLLVLTGIWLMIMLIQRGHKYVERKIEENSHKWLRDFSYKGYMLITAQQAMNLINWALKLLKWVIIILLIYLLLPLLFSIFPFTRGWASTLFGLVWSPFKKMVIAVWRYLPKLFTIIVICFVFKYLIRFVKYFFKEIESERLKIGNFHSDWAIPTFNIVRVLLYVFMFVLIFPNLPGSESPIFRGVSVFLGLLVSLGSSTAIGNIVAGFVITYMRPFKIGDRIKFGDVTGDVMEKNLLVTRLRTIYNEEITIPNSSILSGNTTNFSAMAKTEGLVLSVTISVDYKYHWQDIHEALLEAASRTSKVLKDKKPGVLQTALNDFYVSYTLCVYTHETNSFNPIYSELYQHILDVCKERDIEIVSPHLFTLKQDEPPKGKK